MVDMLCPEVSPQHVEYAIMLVNTKTSFIKLIEGLFKRGFNMKISMCSAMCILLNAYLTGVMIPVDGGLIIS